MWMSGDFKCDKGKTKNNSPVFTCLCRIVNRATPVETPVKTSYAVGWPEDVSFCHISLEHIQPNRRTFSATDLLPIAMWFSHSPFKTNFFLLKDSSTIGDIRNRKHVGFWPWAHTCFYDIIGIHGMMAQGKGSKERIKGGERSGDCREGEGRVN